MVYPDCKWCHGRGCLACPGEKMKADAKEAERRLNKNPLSEDAAQFLRLFPEATGIKLPPSTPHRYENGIYRDCPKCGGIGCVSCPEEAEAEYKRQFPNGPVPIATFDIKDPADMARAKAIIGREAIEHAYGPDGGGVAEIIRNLAAGLGGGLG